METNDDTISMQDTASGYKGLMVIDRCFRSLKRMQVKMTPIIKVTGKCGGRGAVHPNETIKLTFNLNQLHIFEAASTKSIC